jgi:predicted phage-related endonuclease
MPITEQQREQRKRYLGSSDMPAICGVSMWADSPNIYDLWLQKTGRLENGRSTPKQDAGNDLEEAILRMFERRMNTTVERGIELQKTVGSVPHVSHLDAGLLRHAEGAALKISHFGQDFVMLPNCAVDAGVEAKFTGWIEHYGEDVSDVPLSVLVQVAHQMWLGEYSLTWVPVLFPVYRDFELQLYQVERGKEVESLIEQIAEQSAWFWKFVTSDTPPPKVIPHLESLKRRKREAGKVVQLDDSAVEKIRLWEEAKKKISFAKSDEENFKKEILTLLGDAEVGTLPDGRSVTYFQQKTARQTDEALLLVRLRAIGREDIYEECVKQGTCRVARVKAAPKLKRGK